MVRAVQLLVVAGLLYALVDFITGIVFQRCVMPGLKCRECKNGGKHGQPR